MRRARHHAGVPFERGDPVNTIKLRNHIGVIAACVLGMALLSQCTDEGFVPDINLGEAGTITILSGNDQYSRYGTQLTDPLVVEIKTDEGTPTAGIAIRFTAIQGGGTVTQDQVLTDGNGRASTRLTLGSAAGPNQVRASVSSDPQLSVVFDAVSSNFFCPEAEDELTVCGNPAICPTAYVPNTILDLFLVTARSELYPGLSAGVVQVNISSQAARPFAEIPYVSWVPVIWDGVFTPRGDYFVAQRRLFVEIVKIGVDGSMSTFASLSSSVVDYTGIELASNPVGLLVGCDVNGPFIIRCNTVLRYNEASYSGGINNDALAVDPRKHSEDPLGEDIYFINTADRTLYRLPMDSLAVETQGLQTVAPLTAEQALGARGMVCDGTDGNIYILVDTDTTKEIIKVTTAGGVSQVFDFFSRGGGTAQEAGIQSDLALRKPLLFTLDTLNDKMLVYDLGGTFTPLFSDSIEQAKLSKRDSAGNLSGGERVGLDVLK